VNDGSFHYVVGTYNKSRSVLYVDGTQDNSLSTSNNMATNAIDLAIGETLTTGNAKTSREWEGIIDEVRVSNTARKSTWITTEYNNQRFPAQFHYPMIQETWTCGGGGGGGSGTVDVQVSTSSDDCLRWSVNSIDLTDPNQRLDTFNTPSSSSGMRFQGVTVPKGATITTAYLKVRARFDVLMPTEGTTIYGQAAEDPITFSTSGDYDGRARTTASVYWSLASPPGPPWVADIDYTSPEIKTIVQEIVNRAGWVSGNDMVMFFVPDGNQDVWAYAYDGSATYAPKLHIEYTT
jgi:hypothetical protein